MLSVQLFEDMAELSEMEDTLLESTHHPTKEGKKDPKSNRIAPRKGNFVNTEAGQSFNTVSRTVSSAATFG